MRRSRCWCVWKRRNDRFDVASMFRGGNAILERYVHITRRLSTKIPDHFNSIGRNPKHAAGGQPRRRLAWAGPQAGVRESHFYFSLIHRHEKMIKIWNTAELSLRVQRSEKYGHFLASKIWLARHRAIPEGMALSQFTLHNFLA